VASKRIKRLHTSSSSTKSLKAFARELLKAGTESKVLEAWQLNKGITL
jgi:hypothetical protein